MDVNENGEDENKMELKKDFCDAINKVIKEPINYDDPVAICNIPRRDKDHSL